MGTMVAWLTNFNPRTHTGCDVFDDIFFDRRHNFNPRTHTGCDLANTVIVEGGQISIHAPTRGATIFQSPKLIALSNFNPRTHTGCDFNRQIISQSTVNFNPRTHTGCDYEAEDQKQSKTISIHAPTRGATSVCFCYEIVNRYFNPRTHTGCDFMQ